MARRRRKVTRRGRRSLTLNPRSKTLRTRAAVRHRSSVERFRNPRRRHTRRRRNPRGSGILARGFALAGGAALIQFTLGFVPPIGGASPIADAARTFAVGWIYGMAFRRIGPLSAYSDDLTLAGATLAGGKIISSFILPFASRLFPTQARQNGMSGIAAVHGIPPIIVPPPIAAEGNGVQGLGVMPGRFAW